MVLEDTDEVIRRVIEFRRSVHACTLHGGACSAERG
jgi:uncharacterized protein YlzI (FlbEa/FlbD family)